MNNQYVKIEKTNNIGTLIINNPKTLNSMNEEVMTQLINELDGLIEDQSIRVIIITGDGEKSFVSGGDIPLELSLRSEDAYEVSQLGHRLMSAIEDCPKPVIAAINGYCIGGGIELIVSCDLRIAVDTAIFSMPSINVGTTCGFGGSYRLPRLIGIGKAKYLMMTGKTIDAQEALNINLVEAIYSKDQFKSEVNKLAETLASKSMYTLSKTKEAINISNNIDYDLLAEQDSQIYSEVSESFDKVEGMTAFLEKRKPNFEDK